MDRFDYVVAGAGSAGCVIAARLSEDPQNRVLLLEAGVADGPEIMAVPPAWPALIRSEVDWGTRPSRSPRRVVSPAGTRAARFWAGPAASTRWPSSAVTAPTTTSGRQPASPGAADSLVVSGAASGVGSVAVQLARHAGARVISLASTPNHEWLAGHGVIPVSYGQGVYDRVRTPRASRRRVRRHLRQRLRRPCTQAGRAADRIDTIIHFAAARRHGVKTDGNAAGASAAVLAELARLIDKGAVEIPIAAS
jgi:GMC oxidoreductase